MEEARHSTPESSFKCGTKCKKQTSGYFVHYLVPILEFKDLNLSHEYSAAYILQHCIGEATELWYMGIHLHPP